MKNHNPDKYVLVWGSHRVTGFSLDTMIRVSRNTQTFSRRGGTQGEQCRIQNTDKSGLVAVTLMKSSASNDYLSLIAKLDERSGAGASPLRIEDLNGTTVHQAKNAWLQKIADDEIGGDLGDNEWVFECDELDMFVGGKVDPQALA